MIKALVVVGSQSLDALPIFLHTRFFFLPNKARELTTSFLSAIKSPGRATNPRKGSLPLGKGYRLHYLLVNEVFVLAIQDIDANPFSPRPLLRKVKAILTNACKGDVTPAKLTRSYIEIFQQLDKALYEELPSESSTKNENDWLVRRGDMVFDHCRFDGVIKENTPVSTRFLSTKDPTSLDPLVSSEPVDSLVSKNKPKTQVFFDPFCAPQLPEVEDRSEEGGGLTGRNSHPSSPRPFVVSSLSHSHEPSLVDGFGARKDPAVVSDSASDGDLSHATHSLRPASIVIPSTSSPTVPSLPVTGSGKSKTEKRKSILSGKFSRGSSFLNNSTAADSSKEEEADSQSNSSSSVGHVTPGRSTLFVNRQSQRYSSKTMK